ncbi:MAG: DUF1080 domain-containing protein [Gemmataceae bacterium]|nr:DUF1080 domain-containing protein [Gemmataceae bacterium]
MLAAIPLSLLTVTSQGAEERQGLLKRVFSKKKPAACCDDKAPAKVTPKPQGQQLPKGEKEPTKLPPAVKPAPVVKDPVVKAPVVAKPVPTIKSGTKNVIAARQPDKVTPATTKIPTGFTSPFNGKDFNGWWGFGTADPMKFKALSPFEQAKKKVESMEDIHAHWKVEGNEIVNDGKGLYLTTEKEYGDFELLLEYKMLPKGDSGIYLKYVPQVQIWDFTDPEKFKLGADKGSGGLWNNSPGKPGKDPLVLADKPFGQWNSFRIIQVGARTTIWLNGKLVVDNAILENYFNRKAPLLLRGAIQLQTHGSEIRWRNILIREIPAAEANELLAARNETGFSKVFDGKTLNGWAGAKENYEVVDGSIQCKKGKGGVLYTEKKFADFKARLEFLVPPGGNNGLAIRFPGGNSDAAYSGMCELQVLDNDSPKYAKLDARQYHGSAYAMAPAHRGYMRPAGTWNFQEVTVVGSKITVELNGSVILDTDLSTVKEFMANRAHPGKELKEGHFGFAGHSDPVRFRNIEIKPLGDSKASK